MFFIKFGSSEQKGRSVYAFVYQPKLVEIKTIKKKRDRVDKDLLTLTTLFWEKGVRAGKKPTSNYFFYLF